MHSDKTANNENLTAVPSNWRLLSLMLASLLLLAACVGKPWTTDPLKGTQAETAAKLIDSIATRDARCGKSLAGDISLFYRNPLQTKALTGFLQFSMPASYKFVVLNPLGQPILAIAGDQESFQLIDVLKGSYTAGDILSFALHNNIAKYLIKGNWYYWLTARNHLSSQAIRYINADRDTRGIWFTFQTRNDEHIGVHRLLIDPITKLLLAHIMEDKNGKIIGKISYGRWTTEEKCRQPLEIDITELDYGANIHIKLSNIVISSEHTNYRLPIPIGYTRQYWP